MTARPTAQAQQSLPRTAAERALGRYGAALLVILAVCAALHSMLLAILGALGLLAFAVIRFRKAHRWNRAGGEKAKKHRSKFQGPATRREIQSKLSPRAARKSAAVTLPDLHRSEAHVVIGRTEGIARGAGGQTITDVWSGSRLIWAPPQTMKTGLTACWAADAPGSLLAFSSRCDQYDHTYYARKARADAGNGKVWTLNADGEGGVPTNFAWSPVEGCEDRRTAMRRAGDLMAAAPHDPTGKDAHWDALSKDMLQFLLKAAALLPGADILTVKKWASQPLMAGKAAETLAEYDPDWGDDLVGMVTNALNDERYWSAISSGVRQALSWLDDDRMAAAACPAPGEGINLREFIANGTGTIYIIGADREHGSLAPYFASFGAEAFHVARSVAEAQPGRRLRRPFVIVADEAATIVPLPWDKITAVSSGYNIGITACFQADSQITERWGEARAKTIRTNFTVKIIGPGFTDPDELDALSRICGDVDTWHGDKDQLGTVRLYPPERIRLMADWHALVLHRNARPVEVTVTPVWKRRGYQSAQIIPTERLAIEAPRPPIPLPGAAHIPAVAGSPSQPAVTEPPAVPELTESDEELSWAR